MPLDKETKLNCTGITTTDQSGPEINGSEVVLHAPQISRTGAPPPDAV